MQKIDHKQTVKKSISTALYILKVIVPVYIIANVCNYYELLNHIAFVFEPILGIIGLKAELALSLAGGVIFGNYVAIAFALPLGISYHEWTILATFLGVCHGLVVENEIMAKAGIKRLYSTVIRLSVGSLAGYLVSLFPASFSQEPMVLLENSQQIKTYASLPDLLISSFLEAFSLSAKIIILITLIMFAMEFLKASKFFSKENKSISKILSLIAGFFLGIVYGASILIEEAKRGEMDKKDILYTGVFLIICHSIVEDTLLFAMFGANPIICLGIRVALALLLTPIIIRIIIKIQYKEK